jgi:rare lipoprotein A
MKYQFRQTASGQRFNQLSKTAAHKQIPFGSNVKVTNIANGESVTVRVNDRGPFVEGRIIDLSRSAFGSIADIEEGLVDVRIEVIQ